MQGLQRTLLHGSRLAPGAERSGRHAPFPDSGYLPCRSKPMPLAVTTSRVSNIR